jgi:hypothetical protein
VNDGAVWSLDAFVVSILITINDSLAPVLFAGLGWAVPDPDLLVGLGPGVLPLGETDVLVHLQGGCVMGCDLPILRTADGAKARICLRVDRCSTTCTGDATHLGITPLAFK